VHDSLRVRVCDGIDYRQNQRQPRFQRQRPAGAVFVDANTLDVLEDEKRLAVLSEAGIKEPGDVGMRLKSRAMLA